MRDPRDSRGRNTFLVLALVILGGLLFAAGVMVGRQMQDEHDQESADSLSRLDKRDRGALGPDAGKSLSFHEELNKPVKNRPMVERPKKDPKKDPIKVQPPPEPQPQAGQISLQVASYRERQQADQLIEKLTKMGMGTARLVEGQVPGKGVYYRVRVGPFASQEEADQVRDQLQQSEGLRTMVIREDPSPAR